MFVVLFGSVKYADMSYFPDHPVYDYGDGDGTVNLRSAQLCQTVINYFYFLYVFFSLDFN